MSWALVFLFSWTAFAGSGTYTPHFGTLPTTIETVDEADLEGIQIIQKYDPLIAYLYRKGLEKDRQENELLIRSAPMVSGFSVDPSDMGSSAAEMLGKLSNALSVINSVSVPSTGSVPVVPPAALTPPKIVAHFFSQMLPRRVLQLKARFRLSVFSLKERVEKGDLKPESPELKALLHLGELYKIGNLSRDGGDPLSIEEELSVLQAAARIEKILPTTVGPSPSINESIAADVVLLSSLKAIPPPN